MSGRMRVEFLFQPKVSTIPLSPDANVGECPRMSANILGLPNREPVSRPYLLKGVEASISLIVSDSLFVVFCRGDPSQPREVREVREHFRPYVLINVVK
jgi:hypothetical protein